MNDVSGLLDAWSDGEGAGVGVEGGRRSEGGAVLVGGACWANDVMTDGQPAENGNTESSEPVMEYIDNGPPTVRRWSRRLVRPVRWRSSGRSRPVWIEWVQVW